MNKSSAYESLQYNEIKNFYTVYESLLCKSYITKYDI